MNTAYFTVENYKEKLRIQAQHWLIYFEIFLNFDEDARRQKQVLLHLLSPPDMLHRTQSKAACKTTFLLRRIGLCEVGHKKFLEIFAIQGNLTLKEKDQVIF